MFQSSMRGGAQYGANGCRRRRANCLCAASPFSEIFDRSPTITPVRTQEHLRSEPPRRQPADSSRRGWRLPWRRSASQVRSQTNSCGGSMAEYWRRQRLAPADADTKQRQLTDRQGWHASGGRHSAPGGIWLARTTRLPEGGTACPEEANKFVEPSAALLHRAR